MGGIRDYRNPYREPQFFLLGGGVTRGERAVKLSAQPLGAASTRLGGIRWEELRAV